MREGAALTGAVAAVKGVAAGGIGEGDGSGDLAAAPGAAVERQAGFECGDTEQALLLGRRECCLDGVLKLVDGRGGELEHTVEATLPSPEQQRLLGIAALEPCLALYRRSWSRGKVATAVTLTYPASRYALYSRHRTGERGTFSQ